MNHEEIDKSHWFPEKISEHEIVEEWQRRMADPPRQRPLRSPARYILEHLESTEIDDQSFRPPTNPAVDN